MASPVYSKLLYEVRNPPALSEVVYSVPAGYITVVRDIDADSLEWSALQALQGFQLNTVVNSVQIWSLIHPYVYGAKHYQWQGRQILETGDGLRLTPFDADWQFRISGYELKLP